MAQTQPESPMTPPVHVHVNVAGVGFTLTAEMTTLDSSVKYEVWKPFSNLTADGVQAARTEAVNACINVMGWLT